MYMRKQIYIVFTVLVSALLLASCANRGVGPQGGPKDSIPPLPLQAVPEVGTLEFNSKRIEISFNEYLQLDNIAQNLLMSPPQQNPPEVKARGKKLVVTFQDSLMENTTYTIDFGNAVCDYREKVPLKGYSYYFSTGKEIDTLETTGRVFDAENLNPLSGILVGITDDLSDTAFASKPLLRIARTDSLGRFRIANIREGNYRLYAVDEMSRDYRFTIGEALAFEPELLSITPQTVSAPDTTNLSADSLSMSTDSICNVPALAVGHTMFLFKEQRQKLYLQRMIRDQQHRIQLFFSSSPDSMPQLRPIPDSIHYYTQYSSKGDTITLWLTDSMSIRHDSIFFEARYRRTDSLYQLEWTSDTLRAVWRSPKLSAKAREALERRNRNRRLDLKPNARSNFEIYDTLQLACATPLASINEGGIQLFERIDTIYKEVPVKLLPHDTLPMRLMFAASIEPGKKYELRLDSGTLHDIYGITHIAAKYPMQVKAVEDYSTLRVKLIPFEPMARIQVLNSRDQVVRELPAIESGAFFEYLKPDTYYLRLYLDWNGDGKWTTGEWDSKRQPEPVYYFPEKIQTKSNWDFEEEWDYHALPQTKSKPKELIKASAGNKK